MNYIKINITLLLLLLAHFIIAQGHHHGSVSNEVAAADCPAGQIKIGDVCTDTIGLFGRIEAVKENTDGSVTYYFNDGTPSLTVIQDDTETIIASPYIIEGFTYPVGTQLSTMIAAIIGELHPPVNLTDNVGPFSWNTTTQDGNIPQPTRVGQALDGVVTVSYGDGNPNQTINFHGSNVKTTIPITIGDTTFAIGTPIENIFSNFTGVNSDADTDISGFYINATSDSLCIDEDDKHFCIAKTDIQSTYQQFSPNITLSDTTDNATSLNEICAYANANDIPVGSEIYVGGYVVKLYTDASCGLLDVPVQVIDQNPIAGNGVIADTASTGEIYFHIDSVWLCSYVSTFCGNSNPDTDGDGVSDDDEATAGTNPNDPCDPNPTALQTNDCDDDGLTLAQETTAGSSDANPDTDGDGVQDSIEVIVDMTSPTNNCDLVLASQTLTPNAAFDNGDCDSDGLSNATEIAGTTNALDSDTDGDGNPDNTDPNPSIPTSTPSSNSGSVGIAIITDVVDNSDYFDNNNVNNEGTTTTTDLGTGTATGTVTINNNTGEISYLATAAEAGTTVTINYEVCNNESATNICVTNVLTITIASALSSDFSITKTMDDSIVVGQPTDINIEYTLVGDGDVATITDVLSADLTYNSSTCPSPVFSGNTFTSTTPTITAGTYTCVINVTPTNDLINISNSGTIAGNNTDPNTSNNSSSDVTYVKGEPCPDPLPVYGIDAGVTITTSSVFEGQSGVAEWIYKKNGVPLTLHSWKHLVDSNNTTGYNVIDKGAGVIRFEILAGGGNFGLIEVRFNETFDPNTEGSILLESQLNGGSHETTTGTQISTLGIYGSPQQSANEGQILSTHDYRIYSSFAFGGLASPRGDCSSSANQTFARAATDTKFGVKIDLNGDEEYYVNDVKFFDCEGFSKCSYKYRGNPIRK